MAAIARQPVGLKPQWLQYGDAGGIGCLIIILLIITSIIMLTILSIKLNQKMHKPVASIKLPSNDISVNIAKRLNVQDS